MPFAVSATTVSGRIAETSTNESTCSTYASSSSSRRTVPVAARETDPCRSARSRISARPVSCPTGFAPGRQNFIPL